MTAPIPAMPAAAFAPLQIQPEQIENLQVLVLDRIDPAQNMNRYYVLAVTPTLFGDAALVREWGRIGAPRGSRSLQLHVNEKDAYVELGVWLQRKMRRGYQPRL